MAVILKPPFEKPEISLQDLVEVMVQSITNLEITVAQLVKDMNTLEESIRK